MTRKIKILNSLNHSYRLFLASILVFYGSQSLSGVVNLAWDASPDSGVSGYRLYYGKQSGNYSHTIDIGKTTNCTVSVPDGAVYHFAVTAYNSAGSESGFSNEVVKPFIIGDLNGDGRADLAGLTASGTIYYSTDLRTWNTFPGVLTQLATGDLNGNGRADLVGLTASGEIYYSTDLGNWNKFPGVLTQLAVGDLNGDGRADLAGLTASGTIHYSTNSSIWGVVPGILAQLAVGDLNGDGRADLAGLTASGAIYYSTDLRTWNTFPGILYKLAKSS